MCRTADDSNNNLDDVTQTCWGVARTRLGRLVVAIAAGREEVYPIDVPVECKLSPNRKTIHTGLLVQRY